MRALCPSATAPISHRCHAVRTQSRVPSAADPQGTRRATSDIVQRYQPRRFEEASRAWVAVLDWQPTFAGSSADHPKLCRDCGRQEHRPPHPAPPHHPSHPTPSLRPPASSRTSSARAPQISYGADGYKGLPTLAKPEEIGKGRITSGSRSIDIDDKARNAQFSSLDGGAGLVHFCCLCKEHFALSDRLGKVQKQRERPAASAAAGQVPAARGASAAAGQVPAARGASAAAPSEAVEKYKCPLCDRERWDCDPTTQPGKLLMRKHTPKQLADPHKPLSPSGDCPGGGDPRKKTYLAASECVVVQSKPKPKPRATKSS